MALAQAKFNAWDDWRVAKQRGAPPKELKALKSQWKTLKALCVNASKKRTAISQQSEPHTDDFCVASSMWLIVGQQVRESGLVGVIFGAGSVDEDRVRVRASCKEIREWYNLHLKARNRTERPPAPSLFVPSKPLRSLTPLSLSYVSTCSESSHAYKQEEKKTSDEAVDMVGDLDLVTGATRGDPFAFGTAGTTKAHSHTVYKLQLFVLTFVVCTFEG